MDVPIAERMLRALLEQMIRSEAVDPEDIMQAAEKLRLGGDEEAAHALMTVIVEANAPDQAEWAANRARARFHVIEGASGKAND